MFGNTIMHIVDNNVVNLTKMNETGNASNGDGGIGFSQYGNDNENMRYVDIDGVSATANSSSADLVLPSGTNTIKFARLYWGGRINNSVVNSSPDTLRKVKIRKGTGTYFSAITPATNVVSVAITNTEKVYQSFIDITSYVNSNGAGTYTIADIPLSVGSVSDGGRFGGWSIVIAYENPTQKYNSVRIYDGYSQVYNSGSATTLSVTLTGLNVPNNPLLANEAVMSTMAWEGDASLGGSKANPQGDFLKINNVAASNAVNPVANFWNGTISKNGAFVTTKNPNYNNQMGIDIDEMNVGTGFNIQPNATTLSVQFGTEADQYFPSVFTFSILMKDPLVTLDKAVADANNNTFVDSEEELTYTLSGTNSGSGVAYNTFIVDTLPSNVTYVANSLVVVNAPGVTAGSKTDAADADQAFKASTGGKHYVKFFIGTGATGTAGGQLPTGAAGNYAVKFKVTAEAIPGSIINTARIYSNSQAGDLFTDDGTALIGAAGGPLPVKMTSFTAALAGSNTLLKWTTESEISNDRFEIERSDDGVHFTTRGKVKGNGSTSMVHQYDFTDPLNSAAGIAYYRLRVIDIDGKFSFSKVIALRLNGGMSVEKFSVYPNPFVTDIKVALSIQADVTAGFRIISYDGKEMLSRKIAVQKGDNIVVLKDFGVLPKGNYILEVTTGTDKFIKKIMSN